MRFLLLLGFSLLATLGWSGDGAWSYRLDLENAITGVEYSIADRTFIGQDAMDYQSYQGLVFLEYTRKEQSDLTQSYDWEVRVTYKIGGVVQPEPLVISSIEGNYVYADYITVGAVDPLLGYNFEVVSTEGDWYDSQGNMTTISNPEDDINFPDDIDIRLELRSERWFDLNILTTSAELLEMQFDAATFRADWSYIEGAELYDFEWVWIDALSAEAAEIQITSGNNAFQKPFELKEPTRVRTWKTHHVLDEVYETGMLYFRVRPISQWVQSGTVYDDVKEGEWSYFTSPDNYDPTTGAYILSTVVDHEITVGYENGKNWLYGVAYAENGKSVSSMSYFDGSNRGRQSLTYNTSDNISLVGEAHFDYEGRQTVNVIPAPVSGRELGYQQDFNLVGPGDVFDEADIDHQYYLTDPSPQLSNLSGASEYFSNSNDFTDNLFYDVIPDANGYVYSQVVYRNDGSGRVERVGGIGEEFRVGGDHSIRTFYMTPTHYELKRLFGSNVPDDLDGYRKEMVRDANGQYAVTYFDKRGNVIATGLAGDAPNNLIELENANSETVVTSLLSNNTAIGNYEMVSEHTYVPTFENSSITLQYDLNGIVNTIAGQTTTVNGQQVSFGDLCATCEYNLEISVVDQNGVLLTAVGQTNSVYSQSISASSDCYDANGPLTSTSGVTFMSPSLIYNLGDIQEYRIIKKLIVDVESMTEAFETQLAGASWNNLQGFIDDYTAVLDYSDCFNTCEDYCYWSLKFDFETINGALTWDTYWNGLTSQQQTDIIAICTADACDSDEMYENFDPETMGSLPNVNPWAQGCEGQLGQLVNQLLPGHIFYDDLNSWFWQQFTGTSVTLSNNDEHEIDDLQDPNYMTEEIAMDLILDGYHRESCHYNLCADGAASMNYSSALLPFFDPSDQNAFGTPAGQYSAPWAVSTSVGFLDPFTSHPANTSDLTTESGVAGLDGSYGTGPGYNNIEYAVSYYDEFNASGVANLISEGCAGAGSINTLQDYVNVLVNCMETEDISQNSPNNQSTAYYTELKELLFRSLYDEIKLKIIDFYKVKIECDYYVDNNAVFIQPSIDNIDAVQNDFFSELLGSGVDCEERAYNNTLNWINMIPDECLDVLATNGLYNANFDQSDLILGSQAGNATPAATIEQLFYDYVIEDCPNNTYGWFYDPDDVNNPAQNEYDAIVNLMNDPQVSALCGNLSGVPELITVETPPSYTVTYIDQVCLDAFLVMINDGLSSLDVSNVPSNNTITIGTTNYPELSNCGLSGQEFYFEYSESGGDFYTVINHACPEIRFVATNSFEGGYIVNIADPEFHPSYIVDGGIVTNIWVMTATLSDGSVTEVYLDDKDCSLSEEVTNTVTGLPDIFSYTYDPQDCVDEINGQAVIDATVLYSQLLNQTRSAFLETMQSCITSASETFTMEYELKEYQYTLYYYDLVNNLVQTVPPQGVDIVPVTAFNDGTWDGVTEPVHQMETRYQYNGLNTLIESYTPDGGHSVFVHDRLYRVRFSQNARQSADKMASYSKYDELGRIEEAGEFYDGTNLSANVAIAYLETQVENSNFPLIGIQTVMDYTTTYYEQRFLGDPSIGASFEGGEQTNLRNAIGAVSHRQAIYDASGQPVSGSVVETVISYSYDPHKNVKQSVSTNYLLAGIGHKDKIVDYDYDLISGNVNEVVYQRGEQDEYRHQYHYDANNRLVRAYTSRDGGTTWDQDAKYFYYLHGPLARVETGEDHIQGTDYAYNLQGWLKGVNSNTLVSSNDIGKDGNTSDNQHFGVDAFGYSLGYYGDGSTGTITNDYDPIGSNFTAFAETKNATNDNIGNHASLFNGNISNMVTAMRNTDEDIVQPFLNNYKYDQLQRIRSMDVYHNEDLYVNNNFDNAEYYRGGAYSTKYRFDGNGNLMRLERNGHDGQVMDDLRYAYYQEGQTTSVIMTTQMMSVNNSNRLSYVNDAVDFVLNGPDGDEVNDLKPNQSANNYEYDESGQLIADNSEDIEEIIWSVTGKVKEIRFSVASGKENIRFVYDPMDMRIAKQVFHSCSNVTTTYYTYDPQGNVMATYTHEQYPVGDLQPWTIQGDFAEFYSLSENMIYGSSRLGVDNRNMLLYQGDFEVTYSPQSTFELCDNLDNLTRLYQEDITHDLTHRVVGNKMFEFSNHLGNVLVVATDRKVSYLDGQVTTYSADIVSYSDYYPYGMLLQGERLLAGATPTGSQEVLVEEVLEYTDLSLTVNQDGDLVLSEIATNGWGFHGASSEQLIANGESITFEIEEALTGGNYYQVGLSYSEIDYYQNTIDYAILVEPTGNISVRMLGVYQSGTSISYTVGDICRIKRDSGTIRFYKNGVPIFSTSDINTGAPMIADLSLRRANSGILKVSNLEVDKFINGQLVSNPIVYKGLAGTQVNNQGDLEILSSYNRTGLNYGASGSQTVLNGEYVEFEVTSGLTDNYYALGLSYTNTSHSLTSADYACYINYLSDFVIYENGTGQFNNSYAVGDIIRIYRDYGMIRYYQNGVEVRSVADTDQSVAMVVDITIGILGSTNGCVIKDAVVGKLQTLNTYAASDYMPAHGNESSYRYGFNGMEGDDEVKGKGNSYTTPFRQFDSRIGRWLTIDPVIKFHESPYALNGNNPIWFADPSGADSIKAPDGNNHWIDGDLSGYDGNRLVKATHDGNTTYHSWSESDQAYNYDQNGSKKWKVWHAADKLFAPMTRLDFSYYLLPPAAQAAWEAYRASVRSGLWFAIDYEDPSWQELSQMYIWELGDDNLVVRGNSKKTIKDLKMHSGVGVARYNAMQDWKKGGEKKKWHKSSWGYHLDDFQRSLTGDWVWLEVFLGSYSTLTKVTKSGDIYTFAFEVSNTSSVESLTRFRRVNGIDEGILESRSRGTRYGIGGTFTQKFKWTEKYKLVNGTFTPYYK